ncbi:TonB-dependent receptor [Brevundimonas sp. Root1423]|uniref:TonB-dependent receptor n=1 Tax=Brevundimonas sp. Root1423 TaxID=1736462 RepID=UPI0006F7343D|nr:TonB-dependent receptor [Brevundimonas sp. Root1423]KQY75417.1 TonB-dependent receptor [Brevundimonas sp. Root1423]
MINATRRPRARFLMTATSTFALVLGLSATAASAQTAPQANDSPTEVDEVVVTGIRGALRSALNTKRNADVMVDAINAEDIADFPDANLAESLQRLPGVSIDRDNGEGRTIVVRGLGGDFTRVRLNGLEALSTAGSNDSGTSPNRGRGFDFNVFASELFNSIKVQKTASAVTDEGALGATVDLQTGRPFDFSDQRVAFSVADAYYENGGNHNPRVAALYSNRWDTAWGDFGVLGSLAYSERNQTTDSYLRSPGQSDYTYRGATFAGSPTLLPGASIQTRQGFAAPAGTACNNGVIPGVNITNTAYCNTLRGSNPAAYALLHTPIGSTLRNNNTSGAAAAGTTVAAGPLARIPALATLNQQELEQQRLGATMALQWRPRESTTISVDGVYSKFDNNSVNLQIQTVGLNRNNTNAGLNTANAATPVATKRGLYNSCVAQTATDIRDAIDCGQQMNGGGLVPGTTNSFNPFNLDPYDYYNATVSPGYGFDPAGLYMRNAFVGRPSARLIDAALSANGANADYLVIGNVDLRSATDAQQYTTEFKQFSINIDHEFSDTVRGTFLYGFSSSVNDSQGLLVDFIRLDSGQGVAGNGYLVYDARGGGDMPMLDFGFDAANPASWDFVKNYSALRNFVRSVENTYESGRADLAWDINEHYTLKGGFSRRTYEFSTSQAQRLTNETLNPSLREAGVNIADMGRVVNWGQGLNVPDGTTTSFFVPDLAAFQKLFEFDCNCVNQWGDWRLSKLSNAANQFSVVEEDTSGYVQLDLNGDVLGRPLRGNVGIRWAWTDVEANGLTNTARPVSNDHDYLDTLPSLNLAWEVSDDFYIRFGASKVMARPLLGNLAPSVTAFSVPTGAGAVTGGSITLGNTRLSPFRAVNLDLSLEWYFAQDALFSIAFFDKDISSFPQTIVSEGPLSSILDADAIAQLRASQTNVNALAYIDAGSPFAIRQFRDAPGGFIRGVEVNYQQNLTFLPAPFDNFGVQANYTHLESELNYILTPQPLLISPGPFTGASPDAFNFTVFYETSKWNARVSTSYRAEYYTQYPIASGTCDPGFCDSPLVNDFVGSEATMNVDASFRYNINDNFSLSAEALNLTNQTSDRFAYAADPVTTNYASTGRQFFLGVNMRF